MFIKKYQLLVYLCESLGQCKKWSQKQCMVPGNHTLFIILTTVSLFEVIALFLVLLVWRIFRKEGARFVWKLEEVKRCSCPKVGAFFEEEEDWNLLNPLNNYFKAISFFYIKHFYTRTWKLQLKKISHFISITTYFWNLMYIKCAKYLPKNSFLSLLWQKGWYFWSAGSSKWSRIHYL